jgi:hypothetical protein
VRLQQAEIEAQTRSAQFVLQGVPYGLYAVSVFHDENMNGKLDNNFVGAPKEGYGASNNPRKRMGPPPFDEAKFPLNQAAQSIEIKFQRATRLPQKRRSTLSLVAAGNAPAMHLLPPYAPVQLRTREALAAIYGRIVGQCGSYEALSEARSRLAAPRARGQ